MSKIAIFPGSFDPLTIGHESIINRALCLFDKIIVAIGSNSQKTSYFPLQHRLASIAKVFANEPKIEVVAYTGLTVDFCKKVGAQFIVRGLRTSADFEFERTIAQMNKAMKADIETIFILSTPELSAINSTIVRDILRHGGDVNKFVPLGLNLNLEAPLSTEQ